MWRRPDNINALNCFSLGLFTCALRFTLNSNEFNILGPWSCSIFDASSWQCSKFQFGKVLGWNSTTSHSRRVIIDDYGLLDGWFCISSGILSSWRQTTYTSVVEQDLTTVPGVQLGPMSSLYRNPLQPSPGCRKLNLIWFSLVSHFHTGYDFRHLNNRLDVFGITGFILSLSVTALEAALKMLWGLKPPMTTNSVASTFVFHLMPLYSMLIKTESSIIRFQLQLQIYWAKNFQSYQSCGFDACRTMRACGK